MNVLELRDYPLGVLENIIGSKGKQAVDRKLKKYGYGYTSEGRGKTRIYTITSSPDALHQFRSFCVFELGFTAQTDFRKLRDFTFYLLSDDDFNWRSDEMMEEYLRLEGRGMSRQTIGKYKARLEHLELIACNGEYVYYKVYKAYGVQQHEIITKEEYSQAWRLYWNWRNAHPNEDSSPAYRHMYNNFGGVPRKQRRIEQNAIERERLNKLFELASNSILEEVSG